jgi:hypothetical protein
LPPEDADGVSSCARLVSGQRLNRGRRGRGAFSSSSEKKISSSRWPTPLSPITPAAAEERMEGRRESRMS